MTFVTDIPIGGKGSITGLMDTLTALQAELPTLPALEALALGATLRCYRWRPDTPDSPCLYNTMLPGSSEQKDLIRRRDTVVISTRIGQSHTDADQMMANVEIFADAYRALVDANFWDGVAVPGPMQESVTWAMRSSMNTFQDGFGNQTLTGLEFISTFWLDRQVR